MENVEGLYFDWMLSRVVTPRQRTGPSYLKLFQYLDNKPFSYILPMDQNRADDGVSLRYRFGRERGIDQRIIASKIDIRPCSVLEMMVALSLRIEEGIMHDDDIGDRTSVWFWEMINSLGLYNMTDNRFDAAVTRRIVDDFLGRRYFPNGKGGLFTMHHPSENMCSVDIWYQMNYHLNEII